jgi:GAF domain-containing protein
MRRMSKGDEDRDLLDLESDPELAMPGLVEEGRKFFKELLEANRALRLRATEQDQKASRVAGELAEARRHAQRVAVLERENSELVREMAELRQRHEEVELEQQDFAGRYQQIEEQYVMLANLYVASYQLHATLRYEDVLRVVKEILANLVGVRAMRLYLRTRKGDLLLVAGLNTPGEGVARLDPQSDGVIAKVLEDGEGVYRADGGTGSLACIPLRIRKQTVGLLVIDQLLAHKERLTATDRELFDLLGGHVAIAIFRSRRVHRGEERLPPGVSSLADEQVDLNDLLLVT